MKLVIVAIRDSATQMFSRPVFVQSKGVGIRSFIDEVKREDPNNDLFKHPEDFTLCALGTFDDVSGQFENAPEELLRGKDVKGEQ